MSKSVRSLDAPAEVFEALRVRKRIQNVERLAAGEVRTNEESLVFTTSVGTPTDPAKNRKESIRS